MRDVVIIGGGPAGLAAAAFCGRAGHRVVLLERAPRFGGRAASDRCVGAVLNQGPHALYRGGHAMRAVRELGVPFHGVVPNTRSFFFERDGVRFAFPGSVLGLMSTPAMSFGGKLELARLLWSLDERLARSHDFVTVTDWLRAIDAPSAREAMAALVRVSTYSADHDRMSAGAAIRQVALATKEGVEYLDGGWQTLVDGLQSAATASGAELRSGVELRELRRTERGYAIVCEDGTLEADAVVLAIGPRACQSLAPWSASIASAVADLVPVRAACLDVVLSSLPDPSTLFTLGLDRSTYLSVHGAFADLGPKDACVVHVAKYLRSDEQEARAELEATLSRAQPGWEKSAIYTRHLPKMTVTHALPLASRGGRRPAVLVEDAAGLMLAGDWVGDEGMLLDAALASARRAAEAIPGASRRVACSRGDPRDRRPLLSRARAARVGDRLPDDGQRERR